MINIKTTKKIVPQCYAYTTPEIKKHDGWIKIGFTEQDVRERIKQQTQTADFKFKLEWHGNAIFDDGSGDIFRDKDFHTYLRKKSFEQKTNSEWFNISPDVSHNVFKEVTSITLDEFKFLRDGGSYINQETGKTEHYKGNLFDPVVFNDSIKEFLRLKKRIK